MTSQSEGISTRSPVRSKHTQLTICPMNKGKATVGDQVEDEMAKRADDLARRITELEEKLVREEGRRPVV